MIRSWIACWCADDKTVAIYEPAYAEAFDTEAGVAQFHNRLLLEEDSEILCPEDFEQWRDASGVAELPFGKCAGLTVPLFLGGTEEAGNLSLTDTEVYWSMTAQMRSVLDE
ncbi:hypothetical protein Rhe02_10290 [Rhizocola hellebori]|uniref:T6SS immunity protein Tdi1 C-terminal domain-containing protein n=1 Tax=Rhizocola hellebori TaxID=1392758 RepID=A0A8J3Q417_9ACTN|nr:T6SS immunity protein Tdi1 domain-containing protein [Rhizocola hellebori]GIH02962.1 hypothetical protein Rhe02_10290 [Rhizocola hellebori]